MVRSNLILTFRQKFVIIDTLFLWTTSRIRHKTCIEEEKDSMYLEIAKQEGDLGHVEERT